MSEEITEREELFCHEYLQDLNKTRAYMRAYGNDNYASSAVSASRLFKNPNILTRIDELMKERNDSLKIDAAYVLENLISISQRCQQNEEVKEWDYEEKCMKGTGEYQFDSNGANKALELIGKHLGMFKEKVEHSGEIQGFQIVIGDSPDKDSQPG